MTKIQGRGSMPLHAGTKAKTKMEIRGAFRRCGSERLYKEESRRYTTDIPCEERAKTDSTTIEQKRKVIRHDNSIILAQTEHEDVRRREPQALLCVLVFPGQSLKEDPLAKPVCARC